MKKMTVPIRGMHCKSCEMLLEKCIIKIPEVEQVEVSHVSGKGKIWYEGKPPSEHSLRQAVQEAGYELGESGKSGLFSRHSADYVHLANAGAILLLLFILAKITGLDNITVNVGEKNVAMAGLVGLAAGFSSCMALIGGLVLGMSARHSELHPGAGRMEKFRPHLFFNLGRVLGFALLGGLIGLVGSALQPSAWTLGVLTILVGLVMILLGLKLTRLFPFLDRFNLTLPKTLSKLFGLNTDTKEYSHRGAFVSGILTFFLPCGFTQAMQLYAVSTGSFVQGALIMSLFALGTAPGLLGVGGLSSVFKGRSAKIFFSTAGLAVILLGSYNISNASRIVFPPRAASQGSAGDPAPNNPSPGAAGQAGGQTQVIKAEYSIDPGLSPKSFTVKAGQPVRMEINVLEEDYGCMGSIMIPGLYNKGQFMTIGTTVLQFTPQKKGNYRITCAMGIPHGTITVQ